MHSHKKREYSLETRTELAVPSYYAEKQAILEPILLDRASNITRAFQKFLRATCSIIGLYNNIGIYVSSFLPLFLVIKSLFTGFLPPVFIDHWLLFQFLNCALVIMLQR